MRIIWGRERFEISALVDRIIYGPGESFDAADAKRLRELVPLTRRGFSGEVTGSYRGSTGGGYSAAGAAWA